MAYRNMLDIVRDRNPLVLPSTMSVKAACQHMRKRRVGSVLIAKSDRQLVGIFTGRDAVCRVMAEGRDAEKTTLQEVMTCEPTTLAPDDDAIKALRLMTDGGFRHIPVVDGEKIVGVVSRGDFRGIELDRLDEETGFWERI
jgi:CBS domain-containing protein